jgi:hypothetical protein
VLVPTFTVPPPKPCPCDGAGCQPPQSIPHAIFHWSIQGELIPSTTEIHFEQLPGSEKILEPGEFFGIKPESVKANGPDQVIHFDFIAR